MAPGVPLGKTTDLRYYSSRAGPMPWRSKCDFSEAKILILIIPRGNRKCLCCRRASVQMPASPVAKGVKGLARSPKTPASPSGKGWKGPPPSPGTCTDGYDSMDGSGYATFEFDSGLGFKAKQNEMEDEEQSVAASEGGRLLELARDSAASRESSDSSSSTRLRRLAMNE